MLRHPSGAISARGGGSGGRAWCTCTAPQWPRRSAAASSRVPSGSTRPASSCPGWTWCPPARGPMPAPSSGRTICRHTCAGCLARLAHSRSPGGPVARRAQRARSSCLGSWSPPGTTRSAPCGNRESPSHTSPPQPPPATPSLERSHQADATKQHMTQEINQCAGLWRFGRAPRTYRSRIPTRTTRCMRSPPPPERAGNRRRCSLTGLFMAFAIETNSEVPSLDVTRNHNKRK